VPGAVKKSAHEEEPTFTIRFPGLIRFLWSGHRLNRHFFGAGWIRPPSARNNAVAAATRGLPVRDKRAETPPSVGFINPSAQAFGSFDFHGNKH